MRSQEVWAAGVTYFRSRTARMEEAKDSGGGSFYDKVYRAERPELFLKATPHRVASPGEPVRIRKDSRWNVPEPELTLAINTQGRIFGYTIGNDMSSRDIEGENPLYLPQAKVYHRSAALGPCLLVGEPLPATTEIALEIRRGGVPVFNGRTALTEIKRSFTELAAFLFRENTFPHGAYLMTGTGIVPPDEFTLAPLRRRGAHHDRWHRHPDQHSRTPAMNLHGKSLIAGQPGATGGRTFRAFNPAAGATIAPDFHQASEKEAAQALEAAAAAGSIYAAQPAESRAKFLEAIAREIEGLGDALIQRGHEETALPLPRLQGERARTCGQLRLFAEVVREGSWVDARIDTALPDRQPLPRPDLRRMLLPLGPVVVFGASNFPLAFSVAGGDTASALATGCPVIVKAHSSPSRHG